MNEITCDVVQPQDRLSTALLVCAGCVIFNLR